MKKFKKYVVWGICMVVGGIAITLAVIAFLPRTFTVREEVVIDQPVDKVYDYLRNLRNQPSFSMWSQLDPEMNKTFRGTDGEVGSVYAWSSKDENVGIGELEVTSLEASHRIDLEIRFTEPFVSKDPTVIEFEVIDADRTRVKQTYYGNLPYPMNALCSTVAKTIRDGMTTSLQNLKHVIDK